jgi:hypothetical protein
VLKLSEYDTPGANMDPTAGADLCASNNESKMQQQHAVTTGSMNLMPHLVPRPNASRSALAARNTLWTMTMPITMLMTKGL